MTETTYFKLIYLCIFLKFQWGEPLPTTYYLCRPEYSDTNHILNFWYILPRIQNQSLNKNVRWAGKKANPYHNNLLIHICYIIICIVIIILLLSTYIGNRQIRYIYIYICSIGFKIVFLFPQGIFQYYWYLFSATNYPISGDIQISDMLINNAFF